MPHAWASPDSSTCLNRQLDDNTLGDVMDTSEDLGSSGIVSLAVGLISAAILTVGDDALEIELS